MSGIAGPASRPVGLAPLGPLGDKTGDSPPIRSGADSLAPPREAVVASGAIPILSLPKSVDASDNIRKLAEMRMTMTDSLAKDSMAAIEGDSKVKKGKNDEVVQKMAAAAEERRKAAESSLIAKIFGWIALAFTVIASIAVSIVSFGTLTAVAAIATAAVAVTMATLNETGVIDKVTEAIKDSLIKGGMSEDEAQKWAMGIMMGIQIGISIATMAGGIAASVSSVATASVKIATETAKNIQMIGNIARAASSVTTIAQQGANIAGAVQTRDANLTQADAMDIKKFLAKLQAAMEDESQRLQELMDQAQATMTAVMRILTRQSDSMTETTRKMASPI